eukprot:6369526-Prymnesium_polylepis.4
MGMGIGGGDGCCGGIAEGPGIDGGTPFAARLFMYSSYVISGIPRSSSCSEHCRSVVRKWRQSITALPAPTWLVDRSDGSGRCALETCLTRKPSHPVARSTMASSLETIINIRAPRTS